MTRILNWEHSEDIATAKNILWFAYSQLPNPKSMQLEKKIDSFGKASLHNIETEPTYRFYQDFHFTFQNVSARFVFDVAAANKIIGHKIPYVDSKTKMTSDPSFIFDRQADGTKGLSNQPIILAPLFGNIFILDGNHRFNNTASDIIERVDLSYEEGASIITNPVAKEFYLLLHQIYYWPN